MLLGVHLGLHRAEVTTNHGAYITAVSYVVLCYVLSSHKHLGGTTKK